MLIVLHWSATAAYANNYLIRVFLISSGRDPHGRHQQNPSSGRRDFHRDPVRGVLPADHTESDNYGYLGDREQEVLERLIDFIRVTEMRNLGYPDREVSHRTGRQELRSLPADQVPDLRRPDRSTTSRSFSPTPRCWVPRSTSPSSTTTRTSSACSGPSTTQRATRGPTTPKSRQAFPQGQRAEGHQGRAARRCCRRPRTTSTSSARAHPAKTASSHPPGLFDSLVYYDDRQGKTIHQTARIPGKGHETGFREPVQSARRSA